MAVPFFTLRPAYEADRHFLFELYADTLRTHVEWAWGWDEALQRRNMAAALPLADWRVVVVAGQAAGALHVAQEPAAHHLHLLLLRPAFQRQGLGTQLIAGELARARAHDKVLTLKVIKTNPARRLYDRLGFVVTGEDAVSWDMRHAGQAIAPG
jgi:ribosomal protein S18 acetylase RimI-like enzyme